MSEPADLIPGAEAWSADGGPAGVLVIHGFTGNPGSMRGLAEALAAAGFAVDLPRLPGHGTKVEDMIPTRFDDWLGAAEEHYAALAERCDQVVVAGLSMGGALTAWLGSEHPEIAGLVMINAIASEPPGMRDLVQALVDAGTETFDGIGSDIADPNQTERAYAQTPVAPLQSLLDAAAELPERLGRITCPCLIVNSPQDHVVPPDNSQLIAETVKGPVERFTAERSYHVATQDFDREAIEAATVAFARRVTSSERS